MFWALCWHQLFSCSLLVNPSHTDESWAERNMCMWICTLWIFSLSTLEITDENKTFFCSFTTSILVKSSTWCFEHSDDISCSLLVNTSHTDESWTGRNTCMWISLWFSFFLFLKGEINVLTFTGHVYSFAVKNY